MRNVFWRTADPVPGRTSAWTGFVVGIAASIAANVLHAMEGTWTYPELVGAAFWPTALLISVEILTRVAWPRGWQWILARFLGLVVVAFVAAALSYLHMRSLLLTWGEGKFQATVGPAAVDGLMLISATALLALSRSRRTAAVPERSPLLEPIPLGVDAEDRIITAVLDRLPKLPELPQVPQPFPLGKSAALRIPLAGGRAARAARVRRTALAGRRRPSAAASLASTPPPPPEPRTFVTLDGAGHGNAYPNGTAALNGTARSTTSAPLNGTTKPPSTKKPARRGKKAPAASGDAFDRAFQYWQSELAAGRKPSARQLADAIGVSSATGGRYLQKLESAS